MYRHKRDEELVCLAKSGATLAFEELTKRYNNLVRAKARAYFVSGVASDDLVQEGMVGLWIAMQTFDETKGVPFSGFAEKCVVSHIVDALRKSSRLKNLPLNTATSIYDETLVMGELNPEECVIAKEQDEFTQERIRKSLSKFEYEVLQQFLQGDSYSDIAESFNKDVKAIDNALQRIRRKLGKYT